MTWSIIARDPKTGQFGIAVATKFFASGALVPHVASGIGAVATQALVNPLYGVNGLALLRAGKSAAATVEILIAADDGRDHRQLHVMDASGHTAVHTGAACIGWCGHGAGEGFSVAGNMLAGTQVLEETARAYEEGSALPFAERLVAAMHAGEAAGGDKRGKQSAALRIHGEEDWADLDLRVDDHAEPLAELARLERISRERFVPFMRCLPKKGDPVGVTDRDKIEAEIVKAIEAESAA